MVVLMMKSVWPLLIESALILLQTVPTHLDVDTLKKKLLVKLKNSIISTIFSKYKYFLRTMSTEYLPFTSFMSGN